jgi:hypothetical protein
MSIKPESLEHEQALLRNPGVQIPEYKVERFHINESEGSYDMLQVTCPRSGCGLDFWVRLMWRRSSPYRTRPCPHCFKVSRVPAGRI